MKPDSSITKLIDESNEDDGTQELSNFTGTKGTSLSVSQLESLQIFMMLSASNNLQRNKKSNGDG